MTSVLRRYDQIPARVRYFLVNTPLIYPDLSGDFVGAGTGFFTVSIETASQWGPVGMIADTSLNTWNANNISAEVGQYIGQLYRDTGRALYVYDTLGAGANLLAIFRQVLIVRGYYTEGVEPPTIATYAKVWQSDGFGVMVTRTG